MTQDYYPGQGHEWPYRQSDIAGFDVVEDDIGGFSLKKLGKKITKVAKKVTPKPLYKLGSSAAKTAKKNKGAIALGVSLWNPALGATLAAGARVYDARKAAKQRAAAEDAWDPPMPPDTDFVGPPSGPEGGEGARGFNPIQSSYGGGGGGGGVNALSGVSKNVMLAVGAGVLGLILLRKR